MPKPTKEEVKSSQELKRFNAALEKQGFRPKDPKHPLSEFPPQRLKSVLRTVMLKDSDAWSKSFIERWFQVYGFNVSKRQIGSWLNDSRTMPDIQVARVADLVANVGVDAHCKWAQEATRCNSAGVHEFVSPYTDVLFERAYEGVVEALFRTDAATLVLIKRLSLIADVLNMDEQALNALTAVARLAKHDCWDGVSSTSANDGLEDAARFVSSIIDRRDIAAECAELSDWAAKWSGMVNRSEPLDLPF